MKYILALLLLCTGFVAFAQQDWKRPDYKQIKKNCRVAKSNLYHPALFTRFLNGDTTFTFDEKQHLYYGFQFTKGYHPYGDAGDYSDSLRQLLARAGKLSAEDYKTGIRFCDSILSSDPMHLRTLNSQANLYRLDGDLHAKDIVIAKMNNIVDAILGSGDGVTDSTAYYVLSVSAEYSIISILGFEYGGEQSLKGTNDYLTLKENKYDLKGLYFDVTASFRKMEEMLSK